MESAKERILRAAREVAAEAGAGHLSLDAVAARAGLSKGGLLYNYPSKTKLLEALVAGHIDEFARALEEAEAALVGPRNRVARAFLEAFDADAASREPPPSGLLAAIAEDPGLLAPARTFVRRLLDRMSESEASDPADAMIAYLAVEGLRCMTLFGTDVLTPDERERVMARLRELLGDEARR